MIQHTVTFTLKHPAGSAEETDFLKTGMGLAEIPTVRNFRCLRQIGKKCSFRFGFSMEFDSNEAYEEYNHHPVHQDFVAARWIPEVSDFLELDYIEAAVSG